MHLFCGSRPGILKESERQSGEDRVPRVAPRSSSGTFVAERRAAEQGRR